MQTDQMVFTGSETEQQVAREVWLALRMMGASYAANAPIRQPLANLAGFFGRHPLLAGASDPAAVIDAALTKNSAIFAREVAADGTVTFATTRAGHAPVAEAPPDQRHQLKSRLTEPVPVPVVEAVEPAPPPVQTRVADIWLRPAEPSVVEAPVAEPSPPAVVVAEPTPEVTAEPAAAVAEPVAEAVAPERAVTPTPPVTAPTPIVPEIVVPTVPLDDAAVAAALRDRLTADLRLISFGDEWFLDDLVTRLSRGDFRRIRDYLNERGEPVLDQDLLNDVFGRRVTDRDYALWRFGLNARLSREKREFEFVGTSQARLWTAAGATVIGTTKRRPAEIGQDYRFLVDHPDAPPADLGQSIDHVLTFFEYEYGVLPLDARLAAFLPAPYLEEQRAAVLRFDVPQLYGSFLVELRYPTANRGGFVSGLEQFYAENLVPGARLTLEKTDNDGRYILRFGQLTTGQERRLLHLDERRGRYVFRPVTFYCEVDEDLLLSDTKFPGLNNAKPLEERERRRPEAVVAVTFERVGDKLDDTGETRYWALFDDLLAAANVERPFTAGYLRSVLESEAHPQFERDADGTAYSYFPARNQ